MPLTREERKLLHQKSKQPTFGAGKPDNEEGFDGDVSYRQVHGSGTVQYLKEGGLWKAISSSGDMPPVRTGQGGGSTFLSTSGGVTEHPDLTSLDSDDHIQYLLIDGTRAMDSVLTIGSDADGTDRSITWGHSTLKTIMGILDGSDAFVINTDAAFEGTLADNSFSIDASDNVIIRGNITSGGDLTITGGDIIYGNGQNATNTITATAHNASGKYLTISAGNTTAGTTNNIAGGTLTLQGGQGKGTGAGGDIVFKTANAGSSGSSLNALATALTISDDLSASFKGNLNLKSSGPIINWNNGDITLTHSSGKLTFGGDGAVELDFNNHEMTNVDIDSGDIGAVTISGDNTWSSDQTGVSSLTLADGKSVNLTTGNITLTTGNIIFTPSSNDTVTIDAATNGALSITTVDTAAAAANIQITADGTSEIAGTTVTLDSSGDIVLSADGDQVTMDDGTTTRFTFNVDSTPEIDVTGAFIIDGSSTITIDSVGSTFITTNGSERFEADTAGHIYLHNPQQTLYNDYGITMEKDLYHFTTGKADYQQNYTMLHIYTYPAASKHETYPGA